MKTGILITARLGSTRLPKKHLLEIGERPIILVLLERIMHEFQEEMANEAVLVIIATSDETDNRAFEEVVSDRVNVFYGSRDNIPFRHFQTADFYGLDNIVAVDGDDILCSVRGMRAVYQSIRQGSSYSKTAGLPFGMNSMGYTTSFLRSCVEAHINDVLETGWGRVFGEASAETITFTVAYDERLRFTLDYEEDLEFFKQVMDLFQDRIIRANDEDIIETVMSKRLYRLNESVNEEYWNNFYANIEKEGESVES